MRAVHAVHRLALLALILAGPSTARADIAPSNDPACAQREENGPCVAADGNPGRCKAGSTERGGYLVCEALARSQTATPGAAPIPAAATTSGCSTTRSSAIPPLALFGFLAGALALAAARRRRR